MSGVPTSRPPVGESANPTYVVDCAVETRTDLKVDLAALIRMYPTEYAATECDPPYQPWERPMNFLWAFLEDLDSGSGGYYHEGVTEGWVDWDLQSLRWTEEKFAALCAVCPEASATGGPT